MVSAGAPQTSSTASAAATTTGFPPSVFSCVFGSHSRSSARATVALLEELLRRYRLFQEGGIVSPAAATART